MMKTADYHPEKCNDLCILYFMLIQKCILRLMDFQFKKKKNDCRKLHTWQTISYLTCPFTTKNLIKHKITVFQIFHNRHHRTIILERRNNKNENIIALAFCLDRKICLFRFCHRQEKPKHCNLVELRRQMLKYEVVVGGV